MGAGNVLICNVIDYSYNDDEVGGAVPTGTVVETDLPIRIMNQPNTIALLEQGVETTNIYLGRIMKHTADIENNNEIVVTSPANSPYYNWHFRVLGDAQRTSTHASDSRGFLLVNLRRINKSRSIQ